MPGSRQRNVSAPLSDFATAYIQNSENFVTGPNGLIPEYGAAKKTFKYYEYSQADFLRINMAERGEKAKPNYADYDLTKAEVELTRYNVAHQIGDEEGPNSDDVLNPEEDALMWMTQDALMASDKLFADTCFKDNVWDTDVSGVSTGPGANEFIQFDASGAEFVSPMVSYLDTVEDLTGFRPNKIIMGRDVFTVVKELDEVNEKIKYTQKSVVTTELLASLLEVDRIVVPRGIYNSAKPGVTASYGKIFDSKSILAFYAPDQVTNKQPTAMQRFYWQAFDAASQGNMVYKWFDDEIRADVVELEHYHKFHIVGKSLGAFLKDAVA